MYQKQTVMSDRDIKSSQDLWGGRFAEPTDAFVQRFTASEGFDRQLATYDVAGSRAHANMLAKAGILTEQENKLIQQGLTDVLGEIEREDFKQDGTATDFGDPNQDQDLEHRSMLVEWRWQTDSGAHLAAAVRRDWNDAFDDTTQYRLAGRMPLPAALGDAWASWASAAKNPGFVERFGFTPDTFLGNADLRPEQSRAFELGWTRSFAEGVLDAEIVWHRTRLEDEINGFAFDPGTGLFTAGIILGCI